MPTAIPFPLPTAGPGADHQPRSLPWVSFGGGCALWRAVRGGQGSPLVSGGGCSVHPEQVLCAEASELINDGGGARLPL